MVLNRMKFDRMNQRIPVGILQFFEKSYVKYDTSKVENGYIVRGNKVFIQADDYGKDIPLFHEIAHFIQADDSRLHLSNYGYQDGHGNEDKSGDYYGEHWPDLLCEMETTAIEWVLYKNFGLKSQDKTLKDAARTNFTHLTGWKNYKRFRKYNRVQMDNYIYRELKLLVAHWDYYNAIENEWKRKNRLFRTRMKKRHTIIPRKK